MFIVKESEKEYRSGDYGPKYLMQGPRINFGIIALRPGDDAEGHYHGIMEENFYVTEGVLTIYVEGQKYEIGAGEMIHVEPGEKHYLKNEGDVCLKMIIVLGPYQEVDKIIAPYAG